MPEFIAAVMPTTRRSRRTSSIIVRPNTAVYRGGRAWRARVSPGRARRWRSTSAWPRATSPCPRGRRPRPGRSPCPSAGMHAMRRSAASASRSALRERADVVAVDDAHVGPVQLLPEQARGPDALIDSLSCGPGARTRRRCSPAARRGGLERLAGRATARVQPDAVEVPRHRPDVRDRPAVVVEHHHDHAEAAGLVDRLERHAAGHRAVADDHDDLARVVARRRCSSLSPTA